MKQIVVGLLLMGLLAAGSAQAKVNSCRGFPASKSVCLWPKVERFLVNEDGLAHVLVTVTNRGYYPNYVGYVVECIAKDGPDLPGRREAARVKSAVAIGRTLIPTPLAALGRKDSRAIEIVIYLAGAQADRAECTIYPLY